MKPKASLRARSESGYSLIEVGYTFEAFAGVLIDATVDQIKRYRT